MSETPDAAVVARVLAGNRQEFGTLVSRYQDKIVAYVRYMGFGEADAKDIAQDAFVRAFRHLRRCGEPERFAGWLFRIAANLCRTAGKRSSKRTVEPLEAHRTSLPSEEPGPLELAEASWTRTRVREALDALPADQREALVLMYMMGYSVSEIEEMTGASASAVKMRLKRGRDALRDDLEPMFSEAPEPEEAHERGA
jgi:RNA polymerase sigma-70 factor (ECF subfamily)